MFSVAACPTSRSTPALPSTMPLQVGGVMVLVNDDGAAVGLEGRASGAEDVADAARRAGPTGGPVTLFDVTPGGQAVRAADRLEGQGGADGVEIQCRPPTVAVRDVVADRDLWPGEDHLQQPEAGAAQPAHRHDVEVAE